jgi:hypothetical protein
VTTERLGQVLYYAAPRRTNERKGMRPELVDMYLATVAGWREYNTYRLQLRRPR